ncbi:MAG: type II toxin-antitoxin system Phd/YefM family antitoxin [Planctomycetaceae bacterium]
MKQRQVTQRQLRNESGRLLRAAERGERIVVTRHGEPVAELGPVARRRFVPRAVIAAAGRSAPHIDAAALRAELDAVVDPAADG